jgi:hypothetical protein
MHEASGRTGPTGLDMPDWISDVEAGESKLMEKIPQWLKDAVTQSILNADRWCTTHASPTNRLPVVVLHETESQYLTDLVVLDHSFYLAWVLPALRVYWREHPEVTGREQR